MSESSRKKWVGWVVLVLLSLAAGIGSGGWRNSRADGISGRRAENVLRFYVERADRFEDPFQNLGAAQEFFRLPSPEGFVEVPGPVLEAVGYYSLNVMQRDLGGVFLFRANAYGTMTFGVLATSDGDEAHLEVYGVGGQLLGAALLGGPGLPRSVVTWVDRPKVRRRAAN